MRFRDFIKLQSEICTDFTAREVWLEMYDNFIEKKPTVIYSSKSTNTSNQKAKELFDKVLLQHKEDDISNKRIWIMNFFTKSELEERNLKSSDNVLSGFKSTISDDIIGDNGDEYMYLGKSPKYKYYSKNGEYYFRTIGETTLNRVNSWNQDVVSDYEEFLDFK